MNRYERFKEGDRVVMRIMANDPDPVRPGTIGTVMFVDDHGSGRDAWTQVAVDWDDGRKLSVIVPPDVIEVIPR
jgi:hypothetical protein